MHTPDYNLSVRILEGQVYAFNKSITFEGDIEPFMPLIKAGEVLHVGKRDGVWIGEI